MADINGTNANNTISLVGSVQQFTATIVNPYSSASIFIDELKNVNSSSYDGLGGTDTLLGSSLGDVFFAEDSLGNLMFINMERVNGGAGGDVIVLASSNYVIGDVLIRGASEGDILWSNAGNDDVQGSTGDDIIDGGPGNDIVQGQNDNDSLNGGAGSDILSGGNGNDVLQYWADGVWGASSTTNAFSGDSVSLSGLNQSFDIFDGGKTFEVIPIAPDPTNDAATATDTLILTSGNDALLLDDSASARLIVGGLNQFGMNYNSSATSARVIDIDVIDTGDGNDVVNLTSNTFTYGDVTILGGQGNDTLWSGAGNDALNGGNGDDNLQAGAGDDTYIYTSGMDALFDTGGVDTLNIDLGPTMLFTNLNFSRSGNDLIISVNSTNTITIANQLLSGNAIENLHLSNGENYNLVSIANNQAPTLQDDVFNVAMNGSLYGNVILDNGNGADSDPEHSGLTVIGFTATTVNGSTVFVAGNGDMTYTPAYGFSGVDTFTYTVYDGILGLGESTATVTINVVAPNIDPTAQEDSFNGQQDQAVSGNLLFDNGNGADSDSDGGTLSVAATTFATANGGTVTINATGSFTYTPAFGFFGTDTFGYALLDGQGGSDAGTVTLLLNGTPSAATDDFSGIVDNAVIGNVLNDNGNGADSDPDGGTLSVQSTSFATANNATVVLFADGTMVYIPDAGFVGTDTFTYTLHDGQGGSSVGTINVTLAPPPNVDPTAQDDSFNGQQDQVVSGNVLGDNGLGVDSDSDGGTLSVQAATIATAMGGTVSIDAAGDFTYTPAVGFYGTDSFDYTLLDGQGGSDTATVSLILNGKPISANDDFSGDQDTVISGNVLNDNGHGSDADVDGGTLSVQAGTFTTAQGATLTILANGNFTYAPATGYFGLDSFNYTLFDNQGGSAVATATINLAQVVISGGQIDGTPNDDVLNGSSGDDTINGLAGNDKIFGNDGNDELNGGAGKDILDGGNGDDTLHFNADDTFGKGWSAWNVGSIDTVGTQEIVSVKNKTMSHDYFYGGDGYDTLIMTDGHDAMFLDGAQIPRHPDLPVAARIVGIEVIDAGDGNDVVDLTSDQYDYGDVTIYGGDGNDYLWSSVGADHLYGGHGNDQLYADNGDDLLSGGDGNDVLYGGGGIDRLLGDQGNDTLNGDNGSDTLIGGQGNDEIHGGSGNDLIVGGEGNDKLYGDAGSDTFLYQTASEGIDKIYGFEKGVGKDVINITDILEGFTPSSDASAFMKLVNSGSDVQLKINNDGHGNGFQTLATFVGGLGGANLATLLANGNIVADQHITV